MAGWVSSSSQTGKTAYCSISSWGLTLLALFFQFPLQWNICPKDKFEHSNLWVNEKSLQKQKKVFKHCL